VSTAEQLLSGWGRTAPSRAQIVQPGDANAVQVALAAGNARGVIARGLGRSYGDAAQNAGGTVLDTTALSQIHAFDPAGRTVSVGAGLSLDRLLRFTVPRGWFVPVSPGTRFVTVGGAIACDIHGKNHHCDAGFASHVESFELMTTDGERLTLSADARPDEFWATAGGMGLTGVITEATVRLLPIETSMISVDTERASDLEDLLDRMERGDHRYRYSVAWVDCLARGRALGRGVLTRGDHAPLAALSRDDGRDPLGFDPRVRLAAPPWFPGRVLGRIGMRLFNALWYQRAPREERGRPQTIASFFHPLDGIRDWNRFYGPRGLVQYQAVVPFGEEAALMALVERLSDVRAPSLLSVLKRLGPEAGPLGFPIPGWTLTVDLPAATPGLASLLDGIDELVAGAGGRVYLGKDARLRGKLLEVMYPRIDDWRRVRARLDPRGVLASDLDRRLGLRGG
jgi:decaprenylphospho-beta-D-ribofuranose 2-oxidase